MSKEQKEIVIDAFKVGNYPQGKFTLKELSDVESTYDPELYEAPILIGHLSDPAYSGKTTIPAYGWIGKVKIAGKNLKLVASQFSDELKEFIKKGFFKKVSVAFFNPDDPNNPTPGKWHLHHLAFLGGVAPAVKGLEQIAFAELKGLGIEFAEMDTKMDEVEVDDVKDMGTEDTLKDMAEYCGNYLKKAEDALSSDIDSETRKQRLSLAAFDLQSELQKCMDSHFSFVSKLGKMEEGKVEEEEEATELSEKKNWLIEMAQKVGSIITKRKESQMDQVKEQEYQTKITGLEAKVKEFTDAKATADAEAVKQAEEAKKQAMTAKVKEFCDTAIAENRMTPADRQTDEPIMLSLAAVNADALVSFQQKYSKPIVPLGQVPELQGQDKQNGKLQPQLLVKAEEYVKGHPKEFSGMSHEKAISRAHFLATQGKIKL